MFETRSFILGASVVAAAARLALAQPCAEMSWDRVAVSGPSYRSGSVMVYDSDRKVTVLVGGAHDGARLRDMWEWNGAEWRERPTVGSLPGLWSASGVYDSQRQRIVVFGGADAGGGINNSTYEFDGDQWRLAATTGPGARNYVWQMAYDSHRGRTVLFGGGSFTGGPEANDTWEWDGDTWRQVASGGPPASTSHGMTFDQARGVTVVLMNRPDTASYGQTWEWDGVAWRHAATTGPAGSITGYLRLAYDSQRRLVVAFGANVAASSPVNELWEYDGVTWTRRDMVPQPGARAVHMVSYDTDRHRLVTFGGFDGSANWADTWELGCVPPPPQWTTRNLHFNGYTSYASDVQDGQVCGSHRLGFSYTRPFVYTISSDTWVDLSPANAGGTGAQAYGCGGGQQVGYTDLGGLHGGGMWSGTQSSWIDLRPAGGHAIVYGTDGLQQVGHVDAANGGRASIWTGARASHLSIHPAGAYVSYAFGVGGGQQVGMIRLAAGGADRACLWSGSAASYVNLHPAEASRSVARGAHAGHQIGDVEIGGVTRARLWNGAADRFVDLHPAGAVESNGGNIYGELQAGTATFADGRRRAGLWRGTAESWQDLSQYLPAGYTHSGASSVWYDESGTYVSGTAMNASTGWDEAMVWVGPPLIPCLLVSDPVGGSACPGSGVELLVVTEGSGPMTYQWRHDGDEISTATNPSAATSRLALSGFSAADVGLYDCVVANACATVTSSLASVTLSGDTTAIIEQPQDSSISLGQTAQFQVAATGTDLAYRWRKNGLDLVSDDRITGSTSAVLTIGAVAVSDQGAYDCIVSGVCGLAVSEAASLSIPVCTPAWYATAPLPAARWVHGQAFDAISGGTLVFGGRDTTGAYLGDTWLRTEEVWRIAGTAGPSARSDHAIASLGTSGVLLFGGKTTAADSTCLDDTWVWDGGVWTARGTGGPSARGGHRIAFDEARGRAVLFGGFGRDGAYLRDTWEWDGSAWHLANEGGPSARFAHAMAFDPVSGGVLLFGGADALGRLGDTWLWDGAAWNQVGSTGPAARFYGEAQFDPMLGRVLLVGGRGIGSSILNDQWMWNGLAWEERAVGSAPTPRWTHAMSFDPVEARMVMTGGAGAGTLRLGDVWELGGTPVMVRQPEDREIVAPSTLVMDAEVVGNATLIYQWKRNGANVLNGGRVSGARTARLTIAMAEPADSGVYELIARNDCATVASRQAIVDVRCVADFNLDGGIDGADVAAFFEAWESGDGQADVNEDGGVDGLDVEYFFLRWEGGC